MWWNLPFLQVNRLGHLNFITNPLQSEFKVASVITKVPGTVAFIWNDLEIGSMKHDPMFGGKDQRHSRWPNSSQCFIKSDANEIRIITKRTTTEVKAKKIVLCTIYEKIVSAIAGGWLNLE